MRVSGDAAQQGDVVVHMDQGIVDLARAVAPVAAAHGFGRDLVVAAVQAEFRQNGLSVHHFIGDAFHKGVEVEDAFLGGKPVQELHDALGILGVLAHRVERCPPGRTGCSRRWTAGCHGGRQP